MKLYNLYEEVILEGLITEGVQDAEIINAINGEYANNGRKFVKRIKIHYNGDDVKDKFGNKTIEGKGWRDLYVHAWGTLSSGEDVIRAYQVYGDTLRGGITRKQERDGVSKDERGWKLFRTDRISQWDTTQLKYWEPIEIAGQKTNISGDDSMSNVKAIVDFSPKGSDPSDTINKDNMNIDPRANIYTYDNSDTGVVVPEPEQPETNDIPQFDSDKEGVGLDDERIKSVLDTDIDSDYEEEDIDVEDDNDEIKNY